MAFRREALLAINGFDPVFRRAGDDVDVCWRLQHAGSWITFAPGAFVWHHRRQGPRAYLRQQAGYGEAEALLQSKHPEKFNGRGEGKWRGVLYGSSLQGLRLGEAMIYRGTYATGLFQCIYQPGPAHWAMLPSTLEWHAAAALVLLAAIAWPLLVVVAGGMLCLSLLVAVFQAIQARVSPDHDGVASRLVVAALCYAQPLVRSWTRYRNAGPRPIASGKKVPAGHPSQNSLAWSGSGAVAYWTEEWRDRTELLAALVRHLDEMRMPKVIDAGWSDWDVEILQNSWTAVQICTTQEEHGGKKRLIRVRYRLKVRGIAKIAAAAGLTLLVAAAVVQLALAAGWGVVLVAGLAVTWWRGARTAGHVLQVIENVAHDLQLIPCPAVAPNRPSRLERG
jgi:hypothetical protein